MSLCISIRFLTGRAHLHHWHAHHSDGKVDWPPAPWRLLRALVAVAGTGLTSLPEALDEHISDIADDPVPVSRLARVLAMLAKPPKIWLSKTSGGHTRQFLPTASKSTGSAVFDSFATVSKEIPMVFDWPDMVLSAGDERFADLQALLRRLTYFGRAESWCEATASLEFPGAVIPEKTHWRCVCLVDDAKPHGREHVDYTLERKLASCWPLLPSGGELTLASQAIELFTSLKRPKESRHNVNLDDDAPFRNFPWGEWKGRLELAKADASKGKEAKPWKLTAIGGWTESERQACLGTCSLEKAAKKKLGDLIKKRVESSEELTKWTSKLHIEASNDTIGLLLLRCLLRSTGDDIENGLERPIGARWVHYTVPRAIYQVPPPHANPRPKPKRQLITLVRFALDTATVNRAVLPSLTDTLLVADKFRSAALAWHRHLAESGQYPVGTHPRNLCGREEDGSRVVGNDHAYFWPRDEDGDGLLDHVSVFCPSGLATDEVDSLRRLLRLKQRGGRPDLLVTPLFIGQHEQFWSQKGSKTFISATPYFCPLHLTHGKGRSGRNRSIARYILNSLRATLHQPDDAADPAIEEIRYRPDESVPKLQQPDEPPLPGSLSGFWADGEARFIRTLAFCRRRRNHEVKGPGKCFQVTFIEPRPSTPFAIGDQAHFGLGLFIPAEQA